MAKVVFLIPFWPDLPGQENEVIEDGLRCAPGPLNPYIVPRLPPKV